MTIDPAVIDDVEEVYRHIDEEAGRWTHSGCSTCGKCCDFDEYDHRLFVTTPEIAYLAARLAPEKLMPMAAGRCPYNVGAKCSIHLHRFAGCRIYFCKGDPEKQFELSQWASGRLKHICETHGLAYTYADLRLALDHIV